MKCIDGVAALREWRRARPAGERIGFVPTMGALHEGHCSLIRRARAECDLVALSVFVNPLQFGAGEDFDAYPRDLPGDAALAAPAGCDLLWTASSADLYPEGFATRIELPRLADRLCGASRPGHFAGVAVVVLKLFHLFRPARAYFGEKDFQQLQIVRRLVRDLDLDLEVIGCPIVREQEGLALSSRNARLSPRAREIAAALSRALRAASERHREGERDGAALVLAACRELADPALSLEYIELVDPETLEPVDSVDPARGARLLVAARVGGVRLIDNIAIGGEGE
jgi:pantoate--beta-alanine ligase